MSLGALMWEAEKNANPGVTDANQRINNDLTGVLRAIQSIRDGLNPPRPPMNLEGEGKEAVKELLLRALSLASIYDVGTGEMWEFIGKKRTGA